MYNEALRQLKIGNEYYVTHNCNPSIFDDAKRLELTRNGQRPYAVIVTCGDARVPPEHIFSAGLGDLFVIRNAGNVVSPIDIGSAEYATEHLGAPLILVMGHTHCGAVATTLEGNATHNIRHITAEIEVAIKGEKDPRKCEWLNAKNSVDKLLTSPVLSHLVENNRLEVVPAMYNIETGIVTFES